MARCMTHFSWFLSLLESSSSALSPTTHSSTQFDGHEISAPSQTRMQMRKMSLLFERNTVDFRSASLQTALQRKKHGRWRQERDAAGGTVLMEKRPEMTQDEATHNSVGRNALQEMYNLELLLHKLRPKMQHLLCNIS